MIIINGQQFTEEQFAQMQQQAYDNYIKQQEQLYKEYDCTCAVITENARGAFMICSLTREPIPNSNFCKNCAAYGHVGFEIIED